MTVKVKINLENPTGNFWIDSGIVVLYKLSNWFSKRLRENFIWVQKGGQPCKRNLNLQVTGS